MKKLAVVLFFAANVTLPASAAVMTWNATLDAAQEIPTNGSPATGVGTVAYDNLTNVLSLDLAWQDLTGEAMQAHIHCCVISPPGNAGIALDLWLMNDPRPSSGTYSTAYDLDVDNPFRAGFTAANGGTAASAFAALMNAMNANQGRAYFNIHTMSYPGGEIRGNLAPIPEPATVAGVLSGLGAILLRRRYGRR